MQLDVSGHHVDVTPALREYVQGKFERIERHFDQTPDVHVVLTVEKLEHRAEAAIRLAGKVLHAEAAGQDMYAAIDALIDKAERQVIKFKSKRRDHRRDVTPHTDWASE